MKRTSFLRATSFVAMAVLTVAMTSGCASLGRSNASGYYGRDEEQAFGRDRQISEREASVKELGIMDARELTDEDAEAVDRRTFLRKAERSIESRRERDQYFKAKPYMKSDRERLGFLNLNSYETRQKWLNSAGIQGAATPHPEEIQSLIEVNDITTGMTKQAVRDSWGEPELVEVSGNPVYGNERWQYSEQNPSTEGFRTQHRTVFFDSGRVSGWESR